VGQSGGPPCCRHFALHDANAGIGPLSRVWSDPLWLVVHRSSHYARSTRLRSRSKRPRPEPLPNPDAGCAETTPLGRTLSVHLADPVAQHGAAASGVGETTSLVAAVKARGAGYLPHGQGSLPRRAAPCGRPVGLRAARARPPARGPLNRPRGPIPLRSSALTAAPRSGTPGAWFSLARKLIHRPSWMRLGRLRPAGKHGRSQVAVDSQRVGPAADPRRRDTRTDSPSRTRASSRAPASLDALLQPSHSWCTTMVAPSALGLGELRPLVYALRRRVAGCLPRL
jgi:hypothetical protein